MSAIDTLQPLERAEIRARRRPRVIVWLWAFEAVSSLIVAWPAARAVADVFGSRPDGDAALFASGGDALVDWVGRSSSARAAIGGALGVSAAITMVLGVAPLLAALGALCHARADGSAPRLSDLAELVGRRFWSMLALLGIASVAQGVAVAAAAGAATASRGALVARLGEARGEQLTVALALVIGFGVVKVGVMHDLARASTVRNGTSVGASIASAWRVYRASWLKLTGAWAWRASLGLVALGAGVLASNALGGRPGAALVALAAAHQAAIGLRIAMRTSWLACALRAIDGSEATSVTQASDVIESSGEPSSSDVTPP